MNDTSWIPSNNSSTSVRCQIFPCLSLLSTHTAFISTEGRHSINIGMTFCFDNNFYFEDHLMVSLTPICVQCYNNCGVKVRICVVTEVYCPIQSIKHSAFWHHFSWGDLFCNRFHIDPTKELFQLISIVFDFIIWLFHRTLYNKLKSTLRNSMDDKNGPQNHQETSTIETVGKFFEQNLQQIAHTNTTINRFLSAFIDHVRKTNISYLFLFDIYLMNNYF